MLFPAVQATAGDTLAIAPAYYHIDQAHHLIVINKSVAALNTESPGAKTHLRLDQTYTFPQPQAVWQTNVSYLVELGGTPYKLYFTALPVAHISTRHAIVDSPSVYAQFSLSESNGTVTQSDLGVEIRGAYSQSFPKKSFELSFWNDTTGAVSRDLSLLGLRTDNKWNLQALYNEPMRLNSKVANELWKEMHQVYYKSAEPDAVSGIAMTYVELFVNEEYRGLYALTERVDRKQLKLKKYSNGIKGELYKGSDWGGAVTFTGLPPFDNTSDIWGGFEYKHPEEEINWTNLYNFVSFVKNSPNEEFYRDYAKRFDITSAVDYYLFLNLTRAADNTGKNIYIAKYKTGDPYFYVPWDLDGVFGNNWAGQPDTVTTDLLGNGFYDRLLQDCSPTGFRALVHKRWVELRKNVITQPRIVEKFRANHAYLRTNNVYEREGSTWSGFPFDEAHLTFIGAWVQSRLSYLDGAFGQHQQCASVLSATSAVAATGVQLYPNPATDFLSVEAHTPEAEVILRDISGKIVLQARLKSGSTTLDVRHLAKGLYVATVLTNKTVKTEKILLR
nr:CotH kinase family protein [Hymenobacter lucidus]